MHRSRTFLLTTIAATTLFGAACAGPTTTALDPAGAPTAIASTAIAAPAAALGATPTTVPATAASAPTPAASPTDSASVATATTTTSGTTAAPAAAVATIDYKIVPDGTKAGYRVREQLVRLSAPSDAVGTTKNLTGDIVLDAAGRIVPGQSKLVVDLSSLQSDSDMRDGFIQRSTLKTDQYPSATFVPTETKGLSSPLPTSGQQTFQLIGNMTIHGVTKPLTWNVTAQVNGSDVTGQATTSFKFEDFGMSPPRAMSVLSVVDDVKLEVTLHLTRST